jgi:hypothetical protein
MRVFQIAATLFALWHLAGLNVAAADEPVAVADYAQLPANRWTLIHREDNSGGKMFAKAVLAENVGRMYLWGTGGEMPARNVYKRYELESFDPASPAWQPAFPKSKQDQWTADDFPPFRILGQSGPDGLKFDEGPRLQVVGGYHATNRVRWWDFDGVMRPSPIHTFNMACWDSKRNRVLYYSDSCTFALDPTTNTWTDLKAEDHPTTCQHVAWASLEYDPLLDRMLLFGGGLATNPSGAAPTWFYDCAANKWERHTQAGEVPPPRCNAPLVYDATSRKMFLFGGNNQAAALSDLWAFDCEHNKWQQLATKVTPPPMFEPAAFALEGRLFVCGHDARQLRRNNLDSSSAVKETWVYDIAKNHWKPASADLRLPGYRWLSATSWPEKNVALLVAFGPERRTYAWRYDPQGEHAELPGASGEVAWKYPEQKLSLEQAEPPMPEAQAKRIAALPPNEFVNAQPPGMLISKTWSTAVIDTDRSEVLYTGGGHSGYSGNDIARYSLANNRWSLDQPPRFPPFLEGTNAGIFGWSYGRMPFSQHTYLWYCYDPVSKTMLYLARPAIPDGTEVQQGDDPDDILIYNSKQHGYASWVYDPAKKLMHPPSFGRTFDNPWHLTLLGTPQGVYALSHERLYHGRVERASGKVDWKLVDAAFPKPREEINYHYEFQPLLHDTKRNRLLQLKGDKSRVDIFARALTDDGRWEQLATEGTAAIGREAVYIPRHDVVLWLGDKLHMFDCATNRMSELDVTLPKGSYNHECAMVYDPTHDVCIALIPQSFSGPMQTFLFRFEPK